jgi:hypothetical protein
MTVKELIERLQELGPECQELEVEIINKYEDDLDAICVCLNKYDDRPSDVTIYNA